MDYISIDIFPPYMYKLAVYGKGGIGKSSISSNLSYILSTRGLKVLHVGCDPKHDSTRLLTGGIPQSTFMESLTEKGKDEVIAEGSNGIYCMECGGAEPGIGCAGKGMTAMFSYISEHTPEDTQVRVCDVLGDVVCGGFSVPMRRNNVDGIVIIASEEFMSIYAANNILRGIANLNGTACVLGMVVNSRDPEDSARIESFAKAAGIRILGIVSRSALFSKAESSGKTVSELFPDSPSYRELAHIADMIQDAIAGRLEPLPAKPLSDRAMMQIAAGKEVTDDEPPKVRTSCSFDSYDRERNVVYSGDFVMPACTSHGAFEMLANLTDATMILHGANNCAFLDEYAWNRETYWVSFSSGRSRKCNIYSTGLDEKTVFTGDTEILKKTIHKAASDGFRYIFVIPTCTSEIIGTDIRGIAESAEEEGVTIIPVSADRSFLSSKFGSYTGSVLALSSMMDWDAPRIPGTVSFIGMDNYPKRDENSRYMDSVLANFGLRRNGDFIAVETVAELLKVPTSQYLIAMGQTFFTKRIMDVVSDRRDILHLESMDGMKGLRTWCETLGKVTGRPGDAKRFLETEERLYRSEISEIRKRTEGRKAIIYTGSDTDSLDWYVEVLDDLGIEVLAIVLWKKRFEDRSRKKCTYSGIRRMPNVELCHLKSTAESLGADLIISGDTRAGRAGLPWSGMAVPYIGRIGAVQWAKRLSRCLGIKPGEGWNMEVSQ